MRRSYWWHELWHRLTCWRCFPGWITGMNRNGRGRGAVDAAVLAGIIFVSIVIFGAIMGYALRGG